MVNGDNTCEHDKADFEKKLSRQERFKVLGVLSVHYMYIRMIYVQYVHNRGKWIVKKHDINGHE